MILVLSGPPGSGKTTVAEGFARAHGFELASAGAMFRELAAGYDMDLGAFGRYAEAHPEVDRDLDDRFVARVEKLAKTRDVVADSRLAAWLLAKRGVPCLKILIDAPLDVRAERVAGREGTSVAQARREIRDRERSERTRYSKIYGIDVRDTSVFDLVLDSSDRTPESIVEELGERVATWKR